MDRIKKIKIKKQDGTFSDYVPIGADAENIDFENGYSLDEIVGDINPDTNGTLEVQLSKVIKYYNTVADMKADPKLRPGDVVETLGYRTVNDGGQSTYHIKDSLLNINPAIENATYIILNNSFVAELIYNNELNIKQFGAYGDGIHDDTNILNDFFDLENIKYRKVNKGTYLITDTVFVRGM